MRQGHSQKIKGCRGQVTPAHKSNRSLTYKLSLPSFALRISLKIITPIQDCVHLSGLMGFLSASGTLHPFCHFEVLLCTCCSLCLESSLFSTAFAKKTQGKPHCPERCFLTLAPTPGALCKLRHLRYTCQGLALLACTASTAWAFPILQEGSSHSLMNAASPAPAHRDHLGILVAWVPDCQIDWRKRKFHSSPHTHVHFRLEKFTTSGSNNKNI